MSEGIPVSSGMMSRRRHLCDATRVFAIGALAPAVAIGCGASGISDGAVNPSKSPVTVHLATDWLKNERGETLKVAIPAFEERNPNIKVQVDAITGEYFTAINTQLAAGTIQEVVLFEGNFFQTFKDQGTFSAIDAALKQQKINMADWTIVPGIYQDKGKQYGMPFQLVCSGWFYNMDLFKERGLKEPDENWTWDDVLTAARALTRPEKNQYGILMGSGDVTWGSLLLSAGAKWHNADKTKTLLADGDGPAAFQWIIDLIHRHHVSPTAAEDREIRGSSKDSFVAGNVGLLPAGLDNAAALAKQIDGKFRFSVMPTPKHPKTKKAVNIWNDQPHVLMNTAEKKGVVSEATALIVFMAGEFVQGRIAVDRGSIPVLKKMQTSPDYLKAPPENMKLVATLLKSPDQETKGYIKGWDEWRPAYNAEIAKAFANTVPAEQALRSAVAAADVVLARYGAQK